MDRVDDALAEVSAILLLAWRFSALFRMAEDTSESLLLELELLSFS